MEFLELFGVKSKKLSVFAFYGPSGTGKSFRAKLVAQQYKINAIIDDGLLIKDEDIIAGHSAKLEKNYMGAVRVALFDDKEHRDSVAKAIKEFNLRRILILGTSEKMVNKIALRLQIPLPEQYIRIEDIATPEQMEQARRSRQIEGKHVIPVRAYEIETNDTKDTKYKKIFVDSVRVALANRGIFNKLFSKTEEEQPSQNTKLFEKSVVKPAFSITARKDISQATLARMVSHYIGQFDECIRLKGLSIKTDETGYKFLMKVDVPFGSKLADLAQKLKKYIIDMIEKVSGILIEDVSIIIDKIIAPKPAAQPV